MEQGKLRKDDLQLDSDSELEGYEEWHGIDSDAEVDLSEGEGDEDMGEESDGDDDSGEEEDERDDDGDAEKVDLEESDEEEGEVDGSSDGDDEAEPEAPSEAKQADEAPAPAPAAPAGRYIPPHLRAAQLGEKAATDGAKVAERMKLERKAQGLLNK